jgi:hypothetical protein
MKKLLVLTMVSVTLFSCGSNSTNSSTKTDITKAEVSKPIEELTIAHQRDEIEGSDYYSMSEPLFVKEGKDGFSMVLSLKQKQGKIVYNDIIVNASKIGSCHENTIIYVLFEDGTKTQLKQWNDFNCDGNVYLDLNHKELKKLNKPIKAIKLVNGRDYESFEKTFTEDFDKNYFVNVIKALENQKVIEVKELPTY